MAKKKYLLFLIFLIVFLSCSAGFAHAALEIKDYPNIPGLTTPSVDCKGNTCLPTYIAYWFGLLVYIAGVLAVISFVVGAVQLISPSVEVHKSATDRMQGAVLGLVLTVSAFMLLRTINPIFITPTLTPLPGVQGIFYYNSSTEEKNPVAMQVSDNTSRPAGFDSLLYDCTGKGANSGGTGPALLVWEFFDTGLEANNDLGQVIVERMSCGDVTDISSFGSLSMMFESPGVYYCYGECGGDMCSGYMSGPSTSSHDNIGEPFAQHVGGVRIVGNYGIIFHTEIGLTNAGNCSLPIINEGDGIKCESVNISASADNIFLWNKDNPSTPSGTGVDFYSEPHGDNVGVQNRGEGFCLISNNKIGKKLIIEDASKLAFNEKNSPYGCGYSSGTTALYQEIYNTFQNRPKSINIMGSYLVVLFGGGGDNGGYCQVFSKSAANLNVQPFTATRHIINNIYIIPTK